MGGALKTVGGIAGGAFGGPAGAAIGSSLGGALGGALEGDPNAEGNAAQLQALKNLQAAYGNQTFLDPEDYVADYQQVNADDLNYFRPELEAAEQLGDTGLAGVSLDPKMKEAQMEALARLSQRAEQGLTLDEEAARNDITRQLEASNRGNQEAILQNMARRGQLGSGAELAGRMAGAQAEYAQAAQQGEQLAAQRDTRALQAALESGNLAGSMRDQEYGEQGDLAKARDAIAQFNLNQRAGVQTRNVGAKNTAGQNESDIRNTAYYQNLNTANKQADQRVAGLKDVTGARNTALIEGAKAGTGVGNTQQQQGATAAARKAGQMDALGDAITGGFTAIDQYGKKKRADSDQNVKLGLDTPEDWK